SPDSRRLALILPSGDIDLVDLTTRRRRHLANSPTGGWPAFDPQGKRLAVACPSKAVQVWDVATGELLTELPQEGTVWSLAWHPDGKRLAVAGHRSSLSLWDLATQKPTWSAEVSRNGGVQTTFSPTGEYIVTNCWNSNLRLWHAETGQELLRMPNWGWGGLTPRVSRDGRQIAARIVGLQLRLWEVALGSGFRRLGRDPVHGKASYYSPSISPDGRLLAVPVETGVALWELQSGRELAFLPTGRLSRTAQFAPGGALLTECAAGLYRWPVRADPADPARVHV